MKITIFHKMGDMLLTMPFFCGYIYEAREFNKETMMKMNPRDMDWKDFVHADHLTSLRDDDDSDDGDDDDDDDDDNNDDASKNISNTESNKDKTMKLSQVMKKHIETTDPSGDPWKVGLKVQTTTDASRVLHSQESFDRYAEQFGDVEVVYDEKYRVWRVPAFKAQRDSYIQGKAATLASSSYGCE